MTQKSLVYMVLAIVVGFTLVSAVPQQIAVYTTPKQMLSTGGVEESLSSEGGTITVTPEDDSEDITNSTQTTEADEAITSQAQPLEFRGSELEQSHLPELLMWWIIDVLIALSIYWVAKQRLA